MELSQLRYLVAVADAGSFTTAARKLGLSQPSLSLGIKRLEEEVGHPLFDRLTRQVIPTEAGSVLLETARRIFAELDRATTEISELRGEVTGVLRVGTIPTIGPFMLPHLIQAFSEKYPHVQISVFETVTDRILQMLESGEIDVALTSTLPERPGIHQETVGAEELLAVVPANHRLASGKSIAWTSLEQENFLVLGGEHCLAEQMARFCRKNRVTGRTVLEGAQLATIAALVQRGMGVSLVPALMKGGHYPGCWFGPVTDPRPTRPICLAWSILRYRSKGARAFIEIARPAVQKLLLDATT